MNRLRNWLLGGFVLLLFILVGISSKYVDFLWFQSMGPTTVFWVTLITGPLTKLIAGVTIALFFLVNLWFALKSFDRVKLVDDQWVDVPKKAVLLPGLAAAAFLAFILASGFSVDWTVIQQFLHRISVGTVDPFFKKDLGYYLFSFPFYQQINNLLQITAFLGLAGTALIYFLAKAFWKQGNSWELWHPAKIHLTILTILFLAAKMWGYSLGKFGLLYQENPLLTGINYTAANARIAGLTFLTWFLVAVILVLIISMFRKGTKLLIFSLVTWIACSFILNSLYPGFIQTFIVKPNEFVRETDYLRNHINSTRQAYGLDHVKLRTFTPQEKNNSLDINNPSLTDLRLWDHRPLKSSYNQLQSIRPYYQFQDIDIDRYASATGQQQVMISARELYTDRLSDQAQTWINLHLTYTHGYGFAANQVSEFSNQGQPIFIAKDLPPEHSSAFPDLQVREPRIYYGEATNDYSIVNTNTSEFDFPQGDTNLTTRYQGKNGIRLNSPLNKLLLAMHFGDINFLISPQLTDESRVLMNRNILTRVSKLAPFLRFDRDPYLVVSKGKLYWFLDAYTTSTFYPYAKYYQDETESLNYIRNSVKVVIDAYNGEVNYYVIDSTDPLIRVWQKIFPHLLKSLSSLSPDLRRHFRYPEYLMAIQRDMLLQYHMTDPKTFYEKEDYWAVPIHNQDETFEPYYVTLKLPDETQNEFVMMQPFSPRSKQNLISWLIARCDGTNYGKLELYNLPKDENIYGPAQIDSRINQDQTISQLITLWNQHQSRVIWGNLLIIPIDNSILYLKPLFMEASQGQQAELKKVVMVYQNQVLIGDTVADALSKISAGPSDLIQTPASLPQTNLPRITRKDELIKLLERSIQEQKQKIREQEQLFDELRRSL